MTWVRDLREYSEDGDWDVEVDDEPTHGTCLHCGGATYMDPAGRSLDYCLRCCQTIRAIQRGHRNEYTKTHPDLDVRRFFSKVLVTGPTDCWLWNAGLRPGGYAQFSVGNVNVRGHRWIYERLIGPIPSGLFLDHLCRNRACVNPAHLEPVTHRENVRRGLQGVLKETCAQGHPWTPENILTRDNGHRRCRLCHCEWDRKARDARKSEREQELAAREAVRPLASGVHVTPTNQNQESA